MSFINLEVTMINTLCRNGRDLLKFAAAFTILMASQTSLATTISFDDIIPIPPEEGENCFCPQPITDEYLSKGLLINNGALGSSTLPSPEGVSPSQALMGLGGGLWLEFVNDLPTFVEFFASAAFDQAVFVEFYGLSGTLLHKTHTDGWLWGDVGTPYVENQRVAFNSAEGISSIYINAAYNLRVGATIDDLTFISEVPESSTIGLLGLGLFGLSMSRRRKFN
ncbi:MAG: PEP-CTERM sorting domain-containing protein [Chitinophagaceae bacterium]|nr:MAG: PEP-CTERM sorting domain-containing protein [Chitinophagaceae bacterium]